MLLAYFFVAFISVILWTMLGAFILTRFVEPPPKGHEILMVMPSLVWPFSLTVGITLWVLSQFIKVIIRR